MTYLRKNIAIDLGTTTILVRTKSKGVVLKEPSVVAFDIYKDTILAVGQEAKEMLGRTPGNIRAIYPMKDGVIADYPSTERMLKYFVKKTIGFSFIKPNAIICVPSQASQVEKRAILQASKEAGINRAYLIEEPLAAAIGAGVDISDPKGRMIIDVGGGTTDVAVISLGGIVVNRSIKVAGNYCDEAIIRYMKKKYNIAIGDKSAEMLKIEMGFDKEMESTLSVKGRNLMNGLPEHIYVSSEDMAEALEEPLRLISEACFDVLSETPPELASDLYDNGVLMTGGGALIRGLGERIQEKIGIDVKIANNTEEVVVLGTQKASSWIKNLETLADNDYQGSKKEIARRESLRKR